MLEEMCKRADSPRWALLGAEEGGLSLSMEEERRQCFRTVLHKVGGRLPIDETTAAIVKGRLSVIFCFSRFSRLLV